MIMKTLRLLLLTLPLAVHAADDLSAALRRGLFEEEANQNLPAAIQAYQSLLTASDEQRKLAATALFRLGECYRKLGQTNDAIAQYQRLLSDFADQSTLATLSRQNLRRLGVFPTATTPGNNPRVISVVSLEARTRLKELLRNEIKIAEQFAREQRKRIETGSMPLGEEVRFERDVLGLKRQLIAVDGLSTSEDRREWRDLLMQEIALAEQAVMIEQRKLESGKSIASEVARLQRDVLILKRELVTFESTPQNASATQAPSAVSVEAARAETTLKQLQSLTRVELRRVLPTVAPDALLTSLLDHLAQAERNLAALKVSNGDSHPSVKSAEATLKSLNQQIDERLDGILQGMAINVAALKQQSAGDTGGTGIVPTDEEEQEIRRIQAIIKNSPDLMNASVRGSSPLLQAASKGQLVVARFLLEHGANVDQQTSDDQGPALLIAASHGHKSMVELLLSKGANPNVKSRGGTTALHEAASKGFVSIVEVLLASKAEVDARNDKEETPLHLTIAAGQDAVVEALLQHGADVNARRGNGDTPLHFAAGRSDAGLIALLLNRGADINARNESGAPPLWAALESGRVESARTLLEKGASVDFAVAGMSPIHQAVQRDSVELVQLLLEHKAQADLPNNDGVTPLQSVVLEVQNPELIPPLIKAGANPNTPLPDAATVRTRTPNSLGTSGQMVSRQPILGAALLQKNLQMIEALLANGADVNSTLPNDGPTVLMQAVSSRSQNLVDAVLRHKPDLEKRVGAGGYERQTALHQAVSRGKLEAIDALIKAGAKVDAQDSKGWTPLHHAAYAGKPEVAAALLRAGANPNIHTLDGTLPLAIARNTGRRSGGEEVAKLLLQNGADESLLRRRSITVTRRGRNYEHVIFQKGTNDFNRHSLYELMASVYAPNAKNLPFPDLRQIAIERFNSGTGTRQILVDLEARVANGSCTNDLWLEWGDLVEIRELEHPLNANWPGLGGTVATNIADCLGRTVSLVIKGRTNQIELNAKASKDNALFIDQDSFRLADVLQRSGLLLTTSDLSRVRVSRRDPLTSQTQEWTLDESKPDRETDFWLRDGDVIEVPEKP